MSRIWNRFREQIKKDREKPGMLLADGVITLLCVVWIVCVAGLVQDFLAERSVSIEEPSFYYALQDGNYQYLLRDPEKPGYGSRREQLPALLCGGRLL